MLIENSESPFKNAIVDSFVKNTTPSTVFGCFMGNYHRETSRDALLEFIVFVCLFTVLVYQKIKSPNLMPRSMIGSW